MRGFGGRESYVNHPEEVSIHIIQTLEVLTPRASYYSRQASWALGELAHEPKRSGPDRVLGKGFLFDPSRGEKIQEKIIKGNT